MANVHVYNGTDFKEIEGDAKNAQYFYSQLYKLNEVTRFFDQAKTVDALYKIAVETATQLLGIDRLGILLIDPLQKVITGTWGCDEKGVVRSEHLSSSAIDGEFRDILQRIENKGKVCIWDNHPLYEFHDDLDDVMVVGLGWTGAVGIWEEDLLIGWIACDNLLNNRPFEPSITHVLRLFAASLCDYRNRLLAEQKISELNCELEFKVKQRTRQLAQVQNALELANIDLELRIQGRTQSLKQKNNQLEIAIKQLSRTENQLSQVQAHRAIKNLVVGSALEITPPLNKAHQQAQELPDLLHSLSEAYAAEDKVATEEILQHCLNLSEELQLTINATNNIALEFNHLATIKVDSIPAQEVNLKEWFNHIIKTSKNSDTAVKDLHIEIKFNTFVDRIILHSDILTQVFKELFLYISLHLNAEQQGNVLINLNIVSGILFVTVEDNGLKIETHLRDSLFHPFVTVDETVESKKLGLSIVFNLVYFLLKGNLSYFDSKLGGAGFLIRCPIALLDKNHQAYLERMTSRLK